MPLLILSAVVKEIKAHWKPFLLVAAIVLTFGAGRYSAPKPTTTVVTQYKDRVVTKTVQVEKKTTAKAQTVVVYRDRIVHADGSSEVKERIEKKSNTQSSQADSKSADVVSTSEGGTKVITVTEDAPRLNMSIGVGLRFNDGALIYGLQANYRLIGPLTVGGIGTFNNHWGQPTVLATVGLSF